MDKLFEELIKPGGFIVFVIAVLPGFVAWRTLQMLRPQGDQKVTEAAVDIVVGSVATALFWFWHPWAAWPTNAGEALLLAAEVFVTPVLITRTYLFGIDFAAERLWIASPHPRAWDYLFNSVARHLRSEGGSSAGIFLIVTLKNGDLVAGVYETPGFASLWPYDRDVLIGQTWELDEVGRPVRAVEGSIGLYLDKDNIDAIQVMDYGVVVQSAQDAASTDAAETTAAGTVVEQKEA